jgi:hypothetical protein
MAAIHGIMQNIEHSWISPTQKRMKGVWKRVLLNQIDLIGKVVWGVYWRWRLGISCMANCYLITFIYDFRIDKRYSNSIMQLCTARLNLPVAGEPFDVMCYNYYETGATT